MQRLPGVYRSMKYCNQTHYQYLMQFLCMVLLFSLIVGGKQYLYPIVLKQKSSHVGLSSELDPIKFLCRPLFRFLLCEQYLNWTISDGMLEWNVKITNGCSCTLLNVKLSCDGFWTIEDIDPSILSVSGGECLVKNGQPVNANTDFNFTYACLLLNPVVVTVLLSHFDVWFMSSDSLTLLSS